jgi:regulatory protein
VTKERLSLRARALRFLAQREHSRAELARKLQRYARPPEPEETGEEFSDSPREFPEPSPQQSFSDEIALILDDFERRGWLSEARFVEQTAHRLSKRYGARRVVQTLREKGACDASIAEVKPYLKEQERGAALEALKRKFSGPPADATARARQMRFLQARGFDYDVIRNALNWNEEDE